MVGVRLFVGEGDEAFTGFDGDAEAEIEGLGVVDAKAPHHEPADESGGARVGDGLSLASDGTDMAAEGEGPEVGVFVEEGDVGVDDAVEEGGPV